MDANGNNTSSGFGTIGDGDFFTALGIRLTPTIGDLGAGNYRFVLWHTDETDRTDNGFGFLTSCDQDLGDELSAFLRYGYSERQVGRLEHLVSAGLVLRDPLDLGRSDIAAVGIAWTRGNRADDGEFSTELGYRFQLTTNMQLSPSVLVVFDPQLSDKTDPVAVQDHGPLRIPGVDDHQAFVLERDQDPTTRRSDSRDSGCEWEEPGRLQHVRRRMRAMGRGVHPRRLQQPQAVAFLGDNEIPAQPGQMQSSAGRGKQIDDPDGGILASEIDPAQNIVRSRDEQQASPHALVEDPTGISDHAAGHLLLVHTTAPVEVAFVKPVPVHHQPPQQRVEATP